MKKMSRITFLSAFLIMAYLLSACSGMPAGIKVDSQSGQSQPQEVVFNGTVESMGGGQWMVSGQAINVDATTKLGANLAVGANVRVEAIVDQTGGVTAKSIELDVVVTDNTNTNTNDNANVNDNTNVNDNANANGNTNDANGNGNGNDNANSNGNGNANSNDNSNANGNSNMNGNDNSNEDKEVFGTVEALATGSITINGVQYMITTSTEFKNLIAVGDQVKAEVTVNADGTFTIREIKKVTTSVGNGNSNSNDDDHSNVNSNSNSNDDDHGGNSNGSGDNGDDHGGSNSNGH